MQRDRINITSHEWSDWAAYFGDRFPTADDDWIESMTERMMRTLAYCGIPHRMMKEDFMDRCRHLAKSLAEIPRDPNNKLDMGER
jgi:hypothetical protein